MLRNDSWWEDPESSLDLFVIYQNYGYGQLELCGFHTLITHSHTEKLAALVSHNTQMLIYTGQKPHSSR